MALKKKLQGDNWYYLRVISVVAGKYSNPIINVELYKTLDPAMLEKPPPDLEIPIEVMFANPIELADPVGNPFSISQLNNPDNNQYRAAYYWLKDNCDLFYGWDDC